MSFLDDPFDLNDLPVGNGGDFEPVPAGWYTVKIVSASVENTKAGTGKYMKVRFDILGPSFQGRVLFTNLNTRNPNPKAEEIGKGQLGDIMRAIGLQRMTDTDQLIGGSLSVKVVVKDDPTYGPGNEVKAFKAVEGSAVPMGVTKTTFAPAAPTAPATSKVPAPWATK